MKVELSKLIAKLESGSRPKGGVKSSVTGIPSLGAEHLNSRGSFNFTKVKYVPEEFFKQQKNGIIEFEDILVVKDGATTGKVSFVDDAFPYKKASINEHVFKLSINKDLAVPKYVFWHLFSSIGKQQILEDFRGATVGGISRGFVDMVKVPLPSLEEQKRIVRELDAAYGLRQKRKQAIALLDDYLKAVFFDMFGDPVTNSKGWPNFRAIDVCDCIVPGRDKPKSFTGDIPWITTEDLVPLGITTNSKKCYGLTGEEISFVRAKIIPKGSVVFSCVGDLGVVSISGQDFVMNQQLHSFQPSSKINPFFLMFNINYRKDYMYKMASSTIVPYMNKTICNNIPIFLPPIELQNDFANLVTRIEFIRDNMNMQACQIEANFNLKMQTAFTN